MASVHKPRRESTREPSNPIQPHRLKTTSLHGPNILVVGGGPAGAYSAAVLSREGFNVALIEKEHFPRYHIGESMLPSIRPFYNFIDAEEKLVKHGFAIKVGAAAKLNQRQAEGYTNFLERGENGFSWNVDAQESGTDVHEGFSVTGIQFDPENDKKPVAAEWKSETGETGVTKFKYLVDGSGRTGIMSTKYLKNRKFNPAFKNTAFWGYWSGVGMYMPNTIRENAPFFEALSDESGWAWFIPLHNGTVSVGVVMNEEVSRIKKSKYSGPDAGVEHYKTQLALAPAVVDLIGSGKLTTEVKTAADYSYSADAYAGPNFRIAGDAGAFIDPFFSSGVHLAYGGATSAATTIAASIRGHCTEEEAVKFHNASVRAAYSRFVVVVLMVYRQLHSQDLPILAEMEDKNFDVCLNDMLIPIILGGADTDHQMSQEAMTETLAYCERALGPDTENKDWRINARAAIEEITGWRGYFEVQKNESGLAVVQERGQLGLRRVNAM
ncbi:putative halogenase [Mycena metata]|uniref:Halogenase n=1 Tax=Mycena metata TaxID=1033252 RepID=A0AAD7MEH6_9AGAR|nr:putative halogenase [Mycena metata]